MSYYYAIAIGRKPGIYTDWGQCFMNISGFSNAIFKKCKTLKEAEDFLLNNKEQKIMMKYKNKNKMKCKSKNEYECKNKMKCKSKNEYECKKTDKKCKKKNENDKKNYIDNIWIENATMIVKNTSIVNDPSSKIFNIYTDGSCINNGTKNAKAGIGVYFGKDNTRNVSEPFYNNPTNQRAELYAIIKAITLLTDWELNNKKIIIYTDSQYSIFCIEKWYQQWVKNGWKTKKNKNVKNKKLIKQLHTLVKTNHILLKHIRSHTNKNDIHSIGNSKADQLAIKGALRHSFI